MTLNKANPSNSSANEMTHLRWKKIVETMYASKKAN
jgi:hypothetical protein